MAAKLGIQLYSLREEIVSDYRGILEKLAAAGYTGVEAAGHPGSTYQEVDPIYRDLGLTVSSAHVPLPIGDTVQESVDQAKTLGAKHLVTGAGPTEFETEDKIKATCESLNQAAQNVEKHGLQLNIHNHWWEYEQLNGKFVYKYMLEHLEPSVLFQLDTYWIKVGGADPASVVGELKDRAKLLHIKDGSGVKGDPHLAVGEGCMDFDEISTASGDQADWWIVELDACATDMLEAVEKSAAFLKGKSYIAG